MCSLIPAFRLLLCSGASRCGGAFSFLWRQITQFLCVTILGLALLPATATSASTQHTITFDHYSLIIDGNRVFIYSGEFHPFRLPSPALWLDVFQKMKAGGFNTICCYFDWDYHSSKSGTYDFTGIRDLDRFLGLASEAGLYAIVRPGPYINAETDSGGFPGWLTTIQGRARSTAPDYLAAACQWLSQVDPIIARHQLTNGTGTIIACQVENEFYDSSSVGQQYMQDLENKMRADGIQVPLTGNHNATFTTGLGATDIAGFDIYPQGFDASNPTQWNPVPEGSSNNASLAGTGTVYYTDGSSAPFELVAGNFWYQSGQNGNPVETQVAAVNYANYPTGSSGHTVYVFGVAVPIDSSKTVQAVALPKVRGSVAGYQAAMHIFAVGH